MTGCEKLITAFKIFSKYNKTKRPTCCSHDMLYVDVEPDTVTEEDKKKLDELGFIISSEFNGFISFEFGSC